MSGVTETSKHVPLRRLDGPASKSSDSWLRKILRCLDAFEAPSHHAVYQGFSTTSNRRTKAAVGHASSRVESRTNMLIVLP